MGILDQARSDVQSILSDLGGFALEVILKTPDEATVVSVIGHHTKHHLPMEFEGVMVDVKTASIAVAEKQLIDQGFPNIRNAAGDVTLNKTLCDVKDSTGVLKNYVVLQVFPDEMLGILIFILGDYKSV